MALMLGPLVYEQVRNCKEMTASRAYRDELDASIEVLRESGVEAVYLTMPSVDGRALGKVATLDHFRETALAGIRIHYAGMTDARADMFGRLIGFGAEEKEGLGIPDLSTLRIHPWEPRTASVLCFYYNEDTGEMLDHDCRGNLARLEHLLHEETGLRMTCGIEPEMMWLRKEADGPQHTTTAYSFYEMTNFHELQPLLLDVIEYGRAMGLDISHGDSEGSSQLEINQSPSTPLRYADDHMRYRQLCRVVARKHGLICSFMPKPFMGSDGNGHHHHVSLVNADGKNAFIGRMKGTARLSKQGAHWIGGLIAHADAITCVGSPTANSYKRYWDVGFWAPFYKGYDYNNRTVVFRIPSPGRVEVRQIDASCNGHLTLAAILMSGLDGLRNQIDPGPPSGGDQFEDPTIPREQRVPLMLHEAIDSFVADRLMHEAFGPDLHRAFHELRVDELQRFWGQVSQWETDFYLERWP